MSLSQRIIESKELAEALSYWATALGIVFALLVGIGTIAKYFADARDREWESARGLYSGFIDVALQHPDMYPFFWSSPGRDDPILKNKYIYFVSKFLWACEDILTAKRMDPTWPKAVKVIMREHVDYFTSDEFLDEKEFYYNPVQLIIDEVVAEYRREKLNA